MAAITWRNVDGPSSRDSAATIAAGTMLANNIQQGLSGIGDVFTQLRDKKITDNNNTFLNALDQYTTPDQLQNAIQSGEISNMLQAFKGNLDPTMRSAADTRLKAMIEAQRASDTHGLNMRKGDASVDNTIASTANTRARTTNQILENNNFQNKVSQENEQHDLNMRKGGQALSSGAIDLAAKGINFQDSLDQRTVKQNKEAYLNKVASSFEVLRNNRRDASVSLANQGFPINQATGSIDIKAIQNNSDLFSKWSNQPQEIKDLFSVDADQRAFLSTFDSEAGQRLLPADRQQFALNPPDIATSEVGAAGQFGVHQALEKALKEATENKEFTENSMVFYNDKNPMEWDTNTETYARKLFPLDEKGNETDKGNYDDLHSFFTTNRGRTVNIDGEDYQIPLSVLTQAAQSQYDAAMGGLFGFADPFTKQGLNDDLNKLLKDPEVRARIIRSHQLNLNKRVKDFSGNLGKDKK